MDDRSTRDDIRIDTESPAAESAAIGAAADTDRTGHDSEHVACRQELAEKHDQVLRALAEADNIRRRAQRDREEYTRYANERLILDLIPVLDNFDRAVEAARTAGDAPSVVEGVELIRREFLRVLERAGVVRYSAVGEPFDPTQHEAVSRIVRGDTTPNTVVGEIGPGYRLNGRVLRPAMVAVAAAPDEDAA